MRAVSNERIHRKLKVINGHWENGEVDEFYSSMKERAYLKPFYSLVTKSTVHRSVILMGPRRVGKTVILWQMISRLISDGVDPKKIFYVTLDTPLFHHMELDELVEHFTTLCSLKNLEGAYVIFDEIQYLKNWDTHLKALTDLYKKTKFIASGSAAGALRRKGEESGAGRFTDFLLPPLTFYEYLDLLGFEDELIEELSETDDFRYKSRNIEKLNKEFLNYINYGGFPEAIFNEEIRKNPQRFIRSDILDKVLLRDLPSLYGITDTQELNRLFTALAFQTGNEISYEGLSKSSGVAKNTIKKYIEYLEAAFLIKKINKIGFDGKKFKREFNFKVYLTNSSLYGALYDFVDEEDSTTMGNLVETAFYDQWLHSIVSSDSFFYARWKKGEVDMVYIDTDGDINWVTEVKWSDRYPSRLSELGNVVTFMQKNVVDTGLVTTKTIQEFGETDGVTLEFIPASVHCYQLGKNHFKHLERNLIFDLEEQERKE